MNENEKNELGDLIISSLENLDEDAKKRIFLHILSVGAEQKVCDYVCEQVTQWMKNDKIKEFLPYEALEQIIKYNYNSEDIELKRIMIVQCLYCENYRINISFIKRVLKIKISDLEDIIDYLVPFKRRGYRSEHRIKISNNFEVSFTNDHPHIPKMQKLQLEMEKLGMEFFSKLCDFLCFPTYDKFLILRSLVEGEEEYLAIKYKNSLQYYVDRLNIETEEEFWDILNKRKKDYQQLMEGNLHEFFFGNLDIKYSYSARCYELVFDELLEKGPVNVTNIGKINDECLRAYMFVLRVQLECTKGLSSISVEQAKIYIEFFNEAFKRRIYDGRFNEALAVFMTSKFKKIFWSNNLEFISYGNLLKPGKGIYRFRRDIRYIGLDELEDILCNIINKMLNSEEEDNYLALFLPLINENIDVSKCVSEKQLQQLEQKKYCEDINVFAIQLIKICVLQNKDSEMLLDNLFKLEIPRNYFYVVLERILNYCMSDNKEILFVKVYLKLIEESFDEIEEIKRMYLTDMLEMKGKILSV